MQTGLVVEGGGMKCAYSAAVLDRFLDDGIRCDYVIGVSAGSANAASFLAGQRGRNLRFYTEHIHESFYFGADAFLKSRDLFGLDYIYSAVSNRTGEDPLDWEAVENNPARYEVVATNALTGEPRYFDKSEMAQDDYTAIKASCALPAACRPRVIDGIPYYDGGVSDAIPVGRALSQGCERLVVILSKPRSFVKKPEGLRQIYTRRCRAYPKVVELLDNRHIRYTANFRRVFELEQEGRAFVFAPSRELPMSTYAMNAADNKRLYELGLQDYMVQRNPLREFLAR